MNTEVAAEPDNRAIAADVKKGQPARHRYTRACNTGVQSIIEAEESADESTEESESPSETEDNSSASDSDEGSD